MIICHFLIRDDSRAQRFGCELISSLSKLLIAIFFFQVYKVLIKLPDGRSYFIFRRYNEFHQLCDKVQILPFFPASNFVMIISSADVMLCGTNSMLIIIKLKKHGIVSRTFNELGRYNAIQHILYYHFHKEDFQRQ